jgi:TPR repeat protein
MKQAAKIFFASLLLPPALLVRAQDTAAIDQLKAKAGAGDADSQNAMGLACENGQGVPVDLAQAADWFQKSAEQGDPNAERNLALLYEAGKGVTQDHATAVQISMFSTKLVTKRPIPNLSGIKDTTESDNTARHWWSYW